MPEDPWPEDTLGKLDVYPHLYRQRKLPPPPPQRRVNRPSPPGPPKIEPLEPLSPLPKVDPAARNLIQIALLVDSSHSMKDYIGLVKSELLHQVKGLARLSRNGKPTRVEVALYDYGTLDIPKSQGHVRRLLPFTTDPSRVSTRLAALRTSGGEEYHGWVLRSALTDLKWGGRRTDLRMIFLVGNEPFNQGPIDANDPARKAWDRGIVVYTFYCGASNDAAAASWDGYDLDPSRPTDFRRNVAHRLQSQARDQGYCFYVTPTRKKAFQQIAERARQLAASPGVSRQLRADLGLVRTQAEALARGQSDEAWRLTTNVRLLRRRVDAAGPGHPLSARLAALEDAADEAWDLQSEESVL